MSSDPTPAEPGIPPPGRAPARPRTVLLACAAFVFTTAAIYTWVWLLLPARLTDGPMLQNVSADAASIVWFTSRPSSDFVSVEMAGERRVWPAANEGQRHRVRLTGLEAGTTYAYEVRVNGRPAATGAFATNPASARAFSFVVFGDSGRATREQYRLADEMTRAAPDFVVHTGDVVYGAGERRDYPQRFFRPYARLLARVCFWPSLGNHDARRPTMGGDYLGVFELPENGPAGLQPERNYWFDFGGARFVIVDSNLERAPLVEIVAPWIERALADPGITWRFVVFHHPPYTCGSHEPAGNVLEGLVPALERAGVDVVFSGHDHNYQRTAPLRGGRPVEADEGVVYIVSGAGGGGLYDVLPSSQRPDIFLAADDQNYSFTHVRIDGDVLTLRQIALGGTVIDEWTRMRSTAPPAGAASP